MWSRLKSMVLFLASFTRFSSWLFNLQSNIIASFLLLFLEPFKRSNFVYLIFFIIIQVFLFAYSFVINDAADKDIDIKAGKFKPIQEYSNRKIILILSILAGGYFLIPLYYGDLLIIIISITTFLLLTFYSLKPLRFKERGLLGMIIMVGASRSALFLIFALFISARSLMTAFFMGWLFIIGFQDELAHQLEDIANDEKSGVNTYGRSLGYDHGKKILTRSLIVTLVYLCIPFLFLEFYTSFVVSATLALFRIGSYILKPFVLARILEI